MNEQMEAADARASAAVVEGVGAQAPEATIQPAASQVLQATLSKSVEALTGGDIKIPIVDQEAGKLAPQAYTALCAFQSMIESLVKQGVEEAREYVIDAKSAASDSDKLIQTAHLIGKAGKDKALAVAIRRKAPAPTAPTAPPTTAPTAPVTAPSQADQLTQAMTPR